MELPQDVGRLLNKIMNLVIDGDLDNDRHDLIIFLMNEYSKKNKADARCL